MRLRTAISGQRGQSSAEYIAALLLVAAIIAVVVASPIGPKVRAAVGELSCTLLSDDGACGGEVAQPPGLAPGEPDGPCVRATSDRSANAQLSVAVGTIGSALEYSRAKRSDGSVEITLKDISEGGATAQSPGAKVDVQTVGRSAGQGSKPRVDWWPRRRGSRPGASTTTPRPTRSPRS